IPLADRASTGDDDEVGAMAAIESCGQGPHIVLGRGVLLGSAPVRGDDSRQREPVHVEDLPRSQWLAWLDDLVSGREQRHPRTSVDVNRRPTDRGKRPNAAGREEVATCDDGAAGGDVGAAGVDVLTATGGRQHGNLVTTLAIRPGRI